MLVVKEWAAPHFDMLANLYKKLVKRYPVYYAFGNHEQRMKEEPLTYPGWLPNRCLGKRHELCR